MFSISHPTRRALMVGTGVVLVAGSTSACLPVAGDDEDKSGSIDPDRRRVAEMAAQIEELQALLTATVLAHPGLASRLAPLRACHTAHHRVLVADSEANPSSTPSPSGGATPAPTPGPSTDSAVPTSPRAALTRLRTSEQAHASALAASATMSQSGALARLLAVLAAGVEQHLGILTEAGAS